MTNGEKIRGMSSDNELAYFLCDLFFKSENDCMDCPARHNCHVGHNGFIDFLKLEANDDNSSA